MTEGQRASLEAAREVNRISYFVDDDGNRLLTRATVLIEIIDAQESELRAARATIARYEAMMGEAVGIEFSGDYTRVRKHSDGWGYWNTMRRQKGPPYPTFPTPLDAYDALKETI